MRMKEDKEESTEKEGHEAPGPFRRSKEFGPELIAMVVVFGDGSLEKGSVVRPFDSASKLFTGCWRSDIDLLNFVQSGSVAVVVAEAAAAAAAAASAASASAATSTSASLC